MRRRRQLFWHSYFCEAVASKSQKKSTPKIPERMKAQNAHLAHIARSVPLKFAITRAYLN
ncbi:MAG: hypothetical protein J6T16_05365 [Opitutales bacterium]|nr:hypothetical protein [Opitutales bacterium]